MPSADHCFGLVASVFDKLGMRLNNQQFFSRTSNTKIQSVALMLYELIFCHLGAEEEADNTTLK